MARDELIACWCLFCVRNRAVAAVGHPPEGLHLHVQGPQHDGEQPALQSRRPVGRFGRRRRSRQGAHISLAFVGLRSLCFLSSLCASFPTRKGIFEPKTRTRPLIGCQSIRFRKNREDGKIATCPLIGYQPLANQSATAFCLESGPPPRL